MELPQSDTSATRISQIREWSIPTNFMEVPVSPPAAKKNYAEWGLPQPPEDRQAARREEAFRLSPTGEPALREPVELPRDEIADRIERGARKRLGIDARELLRRYRNGELENPGAVADLLALANLLRESDPLFGSSK